MEPAKKYELTEPRKNTLDGIGTVQVVIRIRAKRANSRKGNITKSFCIANASVGEVYTLLRSLVAGQPAPRPFRAIPTSRLEAARAKLAAAVTAQPPATPPSGPSLPPTAE